jgi:hyperosmotically inducible protein
MRLPALLLAMLVSLTVAACSRADADVQADVQKELAADAMTASLTATVTDGVATISGVTQTKAQQDRAVAIAQAIKGVKTVESQMQMDDAALTEEVKKAIASTESLRDIPLRLEVKNGEVKLFSDKTNANQRAELVQVARGVFGVNHVEDNMK